MHQCGGLLKGVGGNDKVHRTHQLSLSLSRVRWNQGDDEKGFWEEETHWRSCWFANNILNDNQTLGCRQLHTLCDTQSQSHTVHSHTHCVTHRHTLSTVTHTLCKHRQIFLLANTLSLRRQNMPNASQPTFVETGLMTLRTMAMVEAKQRSGSNVSSKRKQNPTNKRRQHCLTGNSPICISYPQVYKELWLALEQLFKS